MMRRMLWAGVCLLSCAGVAQQAKPAQAAGDPVTFDRLMNDISLPMLETRRRAVAAVATREQAEARRTATRSKMLQLLGGLPEQRGPLHAQVVGTIAQEGFRIEKVIYDSLPGYHVTANLYLPEDGKGPHPAVIYHAGHGPFGKTEAFGLASNLARNGIAVLAYDPLGAGERLQAMDPKTGKSHAGADEHSQAEIPISLIGDHVARYMVWDAMRGIDYLGERKEIDVSRIASYGCSGGGTMSAYLIALDDRAKAGAVACYLTTYAELLPSLGPQDGEQVIPGFIREGLDFPDLVEMAAPRPYAMIATTEDMFPFSGATAAHDEAARIYGLYGAGDGLKWFTGPGRHGAVRPMMPQFVEFFQKVLGVAAEGPPAMATLKVPAREELLCTTTGQVTTALEGRTIYAINRERAQQKLPKRGAIQSQGDLAKLQARLRREVPELTGMRLAPAPLAVRVMETQQRAGYKLEHVMVRTRDGMEMPGLVALPQKAIGSAGVVIMSSHAIEEVAVEGGELDLAAKAGHVALAMTPMPWPFPTGDDKPTMGRMLPWTSRAFLVGKTLVGMRAEDTLSATSWLLQQKGVRTVEAIGEGPAGVAVLHAAAMDPRIDKVRLEGSLVSYTSVLEANVHRGVTEAVVPDVLLHYDLDDLMMAAPAREIAVVEPVNAEGKELTEEESRAAMARSIAADTALGRSGRIRLRKIRTIASRYPMHP